MRLPASEGPDRRVEGCVKKIIRVNQKMDLNHRGNVNVQHFTIFFFLAIPKTFIKSLVQWNLEYNVGMGFQLILVER